MEFASDAAPHVGPTNDAADLSAAEGIAHSSPAKAAADASATKTANVAPAKAAAESSVTTAKSTAVTTAKSPAVTTTAAAATRLRIADKQAAGQRGGHQDRHCPSQHGVFLYVRRSIRHILEFPIGAPCDGHRSKLLEDS
jgi:hypothetical protein